MKNYFDHNPGVVTAAIMVPHPPILLPNIGKGEEKKIADIDQAYRKAAKVISDSDPDTVIIISPHAPSYLDYIQISSGKKASGSMSQFGDLQDAFTIQYDQQLAKEAARLADTENFGLGMLGKQDGTLDHGTMIPLYYLRGLKEETKFLRIGTGGLDNLSHYHAGKLIAQAAANLGKRIAVIASGDLSHCQKEGTNYGYRECGPAYDSKIMEIMGHGDFLSLLQISETEAEEAMVCGQKPFSLLAGILDGLNADAENLAHSAEFGVGYGICTYTNLIQDPEREFEEPARKAIQKRREEKRAKEDAYVRLARNTIETYVNKHRLYEPDEFLRNELNSLGVMNMRKGAFVSIHEHGNLRGCIGTVEPVRENLVQEIIHNAISACSQDPRFYPVQPRELDELDIHVDVLEKPEKIESENQLNPKRYGVIITKGSKRGLLLPDLEGINTIQEQMRAVRQKAGIKQHESGCQIERFEVLRHS